MSMVNDTPQNPGGSLQIAVEGAKRWWEDFGRRQMEEQFGLYIEPGSDVERAAIMGFMCGRLEIDKRGHWEDTQRAIEGLRRKGIVIVGGNDPTKQVTS